ncbi:MAG: universal stress protein [Dehalococcoidia bacterium]|nr:universal stress protein [Dehalococcoidia bacterium]
MFKHIVVTLDGSSYGERVLPYVADLADLGQAHVTLLTVIATDAPPPGAEGDEASSAPPRHSKAYEAYLDKHAEGLRGAGVQNVAVEVRAGSAARTIADAARELGADLIAMSTQGLGAETEQGLGGVASKVLMLAPCPVFMVRIQRPEPARNPAEERWQAEGGANVG